MWKELEERTGWEEMSPPYLPEKKSRPWLGEKGAKEDEQRGQERGRPPPSRVRPGSPHLSLVL